MLLEQPSQYLAPSKGCADLVFLCVTASLTESSAVFVTHFTNVFNMLFPCDWSLFTKKDICHWATVSIVVADGFAVLAFLRSLHHSLLTGSFVSEFCSL